MTTIDGLMRDHILATWTLFTAEDLEDLGIHPDTPMLRLQVGPDQLVPAFQFTPSWEVRPELERLLSVLPHDPTGWKQALWLAEPMPSLFPAFFKTIDIQDPDAWSRPNASEAPVAPVDLFPVNAEAVIEHAAQHFGPGESS